MITTAINNLRPGARFRLEDEDYDKLDWLDEVQTKPTKEEIDAEVINVIANYQATEYQRQRMYEYPNVKEQLDMLWHAIDAGTLNKTSDFYLAIKAVKDANPKAE